MAAQHINIVDLIEKNPLTKLSDKYQSTFLSKIQQQFTSDEQQLFVSSFYCYLNYDPKKDFVIDLDDVWKWIGFARKTNAKYALEKNFVGGVDYEISLPNDQKQVHGGQNKESIMLNIETFKSFCMTANTEKGKHIRKYFIKLETIFQEIIDEESTELKKQLEKTKEMLTIKENALKSTEDQVNKLMRRRWHGQVPGEVVYVYQDSLKDESSLIKIGKTTDIARRESDYNTANQSGAIVYVKRCHNSDLLEKVCHHILDKHRVSKREWFDISLDIAKQTIDSAQMFLDGLIPYSKLFHEKSLSDQLSNVVQSFREDSSEIDTDDESDKEIPNIYQEFNIEEAQKTQTELENFKTPDNIRNPFDFDKFIAECCEVSPDYICLKAELYGAHKIWGRASDRKTKDALYEYMHDRFDHGKKYFEDHNAILVIFKGVRPKPCIFTPNDTANPTDYEQFIMDRCKVGYTHRVSYKTLFTEFVSWKKNSIPNYDLTLPAKREFQKYLNTRFFPEHVFLSTKVNDKTGGGSSTHGVWGITLKDDNINTGLKLSNKLRKKVYQINAETKQVTHVFESVTDAGRAIGVGPSYISTDIRFGRVRNGFMYSLTNPQT